MTDTELEVRRAGGLIQPAADADQIRELFRTFERLKLQLLTPEDYQRIGPRNFVKRSGWRKLATAFSVSFRIVERTILRDESGAVTGAEFIVRAQTPSGRFAEAFGGCDRWERCCPPGCSSKANRHTHCGGRDGWGDNEPCPGGTHFSKPEHDIPATAHTRATSRAAADLFGMGGVPDDEPAARVDEETGEILGPDGRQRARLVAIAKDRPDAYHDALSRREVTSANDLPQSKIENLLAELEEAPA